jgi:hypothetical protein
MGTVYRNPDINLNLSAFVKNAKKIANSNNQGGRRWAN